jgi:RNA polymerase sigma-70 factor, ECF subfamily
MFSVGGIQMANETSSCKCASDRQDVFVRLLARHSPQIFGFILALSPQANDAEDIFQETSAALWRKFDSYQDGTNFRAWACRVAHIEVLGHRRRKYKEQVLSDAALDSIAGDALAVAEGRLPREEALADCLEKLSSTDRSLIELRYFRGKSPRQIADQGSQSVYGVYRALSRIHDALLRCVQRTLSRDQAEARN